MSATPHDIRARFNAAPDFESYLETVVKNRDLWHSLYRRAKVPADLVARASKVEAPLYLLALSEDWCGDAVNTLPVIARWVEALPSVELRILGRDDNPDLMDAHLTNGRSRSIPVVIAYDEDFNEVGWWGPRPAPLQEWVLGPGQELDSDERYLETRKWYVKDRGRTTLTELLRLLRAGTVQAAAGVDLDQTP